MTEEEYIRYFKKQMPTHTFAYDNLDDLATMLMMLEKHGYLGALDWGSDEIIYKGGIAWGKRREITWVAEKSFTIVGEDYPPATLYYEPLVASVLTYIHLNPPFCFSSGDVLQYVIQCTKAKKVPITRKVA